MRIFFTSLDFDKKSEEKFFIIKFYLTWSLLSLSLIKKKKLVKIVKENSLFLLVA